MPDYSGMAEENYKAVTGVAGMADSFGVLQYGTEGWNQRKAEKQRQKAYQQRIERRSEREAKARHFLELLGYAFWTIAAVVALPLLLFAFFIAATLLWQVAF